MFKSQTLRTCVTKYTHKDYDELVKHFDSFVSLSQFEPEVTNTNQLSDIKLLTEPICFWGRTLYGVSDDGELTKLMYIIDSSD